MARIFLSELFTICDFNVSERFSRILMAVMFCREREKFHNLQFALCTKFSVCVTQCEGNEFLSFLSWLTKWREFPKCYMAHLVKVLACLARKSQSYFDSFVIPTILPSH